jgi:hypothetical protein
MEHQLDYNPTADTDVKQEQTYKFTTLHQSSIVRWLSLHDLLTSIEKAYHPLKSVLEEKQESSRIDKINMNIVSQLIKFLDPWKYVLTEIQVGNAPSLFLTLPCVGYLKQQLSKIERTKKGGESAYLTFVWGILRVYLFYLFG